MPFTTRKMPSFEGVAAGQTATLRCPIGRSYHQLLITYSGVTLTQMTGVRVIANGEVIQRLKGGDVLDLFNQYEGRAGASGVIVLDFDRYNLRTREAEEFTALGTGRAGGEGDPPPITTLHVEIDIDAAATSPVLSAKAIQSAPQTTGMIKKIKPYGYTPGGAGDYEISDLPKKGLFNKVYFVTTDTINEIKIERDNFVVFERTKAENELVQSDGVRTPQSDLYVYDPTELGNGSEGLSVEGVGDLRFILNMATGGILVDTYVESIAPLEQ